MTTPFVYTAELIHLRFLFHHVKRGDHRRPFGRPLDYCILAAGAAVAWVFVIELSATIFVTFRRKRGVHFWSLVVSSWRLSIQAMGFILKFLVGTYWRLNIHRVTTVWIAMVTGQAVVLYSRLHLVVRNQRTLRNALCLIFFKRIGSSCSYGYLHIRQQLIQRPCQHVGQKTRR